MGALCYHVNQGRRAGTVNTTELAYNEIHSFGLHNIGPAAAGPAGPIPAPLHGLIFATRRDAQDYIRIVHSAYNYSLIRD